ncbi:MAG TPA: class I SAM-dependent methyltransferase [Ktedonobacterales bacterium]|nr:class I SAM-dependent methyltransferase [Ktedonobacterales bacterium]
MSTKRPYYERLAAAYVRGRLSGSPAHETHHILFSTPLDALAKCDLETLIQIGLDAGLRLHRFKRTMELPRVRKVLGVLKGLQPSSLLDIGSGRGAFLWPLLDAFPDLPVTALDLLDYRVADILAVRDGGVSTVTSLCGDATRLPFADKRFDVVTLLEVLEHIPDTQRALAEVCRVAGRFVVLSVPTKPDNNPEHIHLFDQRTLSELLRAHGMAHIHADYVHNHLIMVARSVEI